MRAKLDWNCLEVAWEKIGREERKMDAIVADVGVCCAKEKSQVYSEGA